MDSTLENAVKALANVCDYATSQDGQGYNGTDANFGHRLAAVSEAEWTPAQAHKAWSMLRKYSQQLSRYGIDYTSIPEPSSAGLAGRIITKRTLSVLWDGL